MRVPLLAWWLVIGSVLCVACGGESDGPGGSGYLYVDEEVTLEEDWVIPAGEVVVVGPGTVFRAATDVAVRVQGTLEVDGAADAPVEFLGGAEPRSWAGLRVEQGGMVVFNHGVVDGATYGIRALEGSTLSVTDSTLRNSFKAAVLEADADFERTVFEAALVQSISIADEVSLEDPNGTVTILDASPSFSQCQFNGASAFTDMVRVGGEASPSFDHVHFRDAHCGIHAFGAINNAPQVHHAIFENLAYGLMAYTARPVVEDSVFLMNGTDVGLCVGATEANTPELRNNHYSEGMPSVDASCFRIGTTDPSPADEPHPDAGASEV